jgi:ribulose-phosphate 3-epimerase
MSPPLSRSTEASLPPTPQDVCAAGATLLVAGSAVFGKADRADAIRKITEAGESGLARRA